MSSTQRGRPTAETPLFATAERPPMLGRRDVELIAGVGERALAHDPRFADLRWVPGALPGEIVIRGSVPDPALIVPLREFAHEWGGIRLDVRVAGERGH